MFSVTIQAIIDEFDCKLLSEKVDVKSKVVVHSEINRPALQLADFYDFFDSDRVQIIGMVEYAYLQSLPSEECDKRLEKLFSCQIPCLVLSRGLQPLPHMIEYAEKYDVPFLSYPESTTNFMGELIRWLRVQLAPRLTMHGVLVDIYGEGVMIIGESGVGKSETALELIKRGHRLVADDAVEIKRVSKSTLIGSCPDVLKYFIELRGVGIIDVKQMFGVESIKATKAIDLIIKLEVWNKDIEYDRLGLKDEYMEILTNRVVCHSIPIRPGRNLAIICEAAAINHRQKKLGYNAAKVLSERVMKNMSKG